MAGVGTRKLFEDERIIVWEFELAPGESTPVHTHEHDYVFYVLEGSHLEVFAGDGAALGGFDAPTGAVFPLNLVGNELVSADDKGLRAPATHMARNAGSSRYREILVEKK